MNRRPPPPAWRLAAWLIMTLAVSADVWGQQQKPDPPLTRTGMELRGPAAGQPAAHTIVQEKRPFYVQGVVVAALFGGALWAVCHSSRRV